PVADALGAAEAAPGLGILTGERPPAGPMAAWTEAFEVVEELPARERTLAAWLAARGAGIVTVRTRGGACDPDAWQRALRGPGSDPWTVFVLRLGSDRLAYAVRRVEA
ncbi:MAG: THUMP-like domain-containing protein, partial [Planctomycetota bacterium]